MAPPAPDTQPDLGQRRRSTGPRSLADDLRARDDAALVELLAGRPDLAVPLPADLGSLAAAATGRLSVQRAIDALDTPTLQVLEVLAALPEPVTAAEVGRRWGAAAGVPLDRLHTLGLVWGGPRALRLVRAARESVGPYPAGLGPPLAEALDRRSPQRLAALLADLELPPTGDPVLAIERIAAHLGHRGTVESLLAAAPAGARAVLDRLTWGPPVGRVDAADRPVRAGTAASPVEWLLARGLLAVADPGHVVLPREVGLALRGGRVHRVPDQSPPPLPHSGRPSAQLDHLAAGAAAEAVRLVESLGELWGTAPPAVLRTGGLGVRELRRTATGLELDDRTAALVVELAHAAGLVADDGEQEPSWLPTPAFDTWLAASTGRRWANLAQAWLPLPRAPVLVGSRDSRNVTMAALSAEVDRQLAAEVRRWALDQLAALDPGTEGSDRSAPDAGGARALAARLDWSSPRRTTAARAELLAACLTEAAWLGVTAAGALSAAGRTLLAGGPDGADAAAAALDAALPEPVDHVLLQADLTAVAPGPLRPDLARELGLAADVESRGAATVYRFGVASVRRALDAGRTGQEVLDGLAAISRTPVPQPLAYLVTDTARRYGRVRIGAAGCYVRADDEAVLGELLADRRTAPLRLRRLAPTVLVTPAQPGVALGLLRELGLVPAAESAEGELLVRRPQARRATGRPTADRARRTAPRLSQERLREVVAALRAADLPGSGPAGHARTASGPMDPATAIAVLRDAVERRREVALRYLDDAGRPVRLVVEPLSVEAGQMRAVDHRDGRVRQFSVHRVVTAAPAGR